MHKFTRGAIEAFVKKYATEQMILDIGSGSTDYQELFPNRTTFDIDPGRNPQVVGDVHRMPFGDGEFEAILCSEVLEHVHTPMLAIKEMMRVLKPGGLLILTTRFIYPVHDVPGDYYRYTPYGLRELFKEWEVIDLAVENDAFSSIAVLLQRIIFQTTLRGGKITKGFVYLLALLLKSLDFLIVERYGNIGRSTKVSTLMTSGVYIACRKKS